MLQHGNIMWVKELFVMDQTKGVVIKTKVKDKKYDADKKRKVVQAQYGANAAKSKKGNLVGAKEKGVYRKGGDAVVETKRCYKKIVVEKMMRKKQISILTLAFS